MRRVHLVTAVSSTAALADGDQLFVSVRIGPDGAVQADEPLEIDTTDPVPAPGG